MTLQQMKYALTIAEQGSMNKAAEQLFISQPSLTSAVRELEKEIGIQVFVRSIPASHKGTYVPYRSTAGAAAQSGNSEFPRSIIPLR